MLSEIRDGILIWRAQTDPFRDPEVARVGAVQIGSRTYVKVVGFPVPAWCIHTTEAMWVRVHQGDAYQGSGILDNIPSWQARAGHQGPAYAHHGDLVSYAGGTGDQKPRFRSILQRAVEA